MSQELQPVKLMDTILKGYSKPQHVLFSDGRTYVVKFKNNPSGTRILVNEYIAGKLGELLSLPVIPFEVVQIEDDFLKKLPIYAKYKLQSGNQFASLYIDNCIQLQRGSKNEDIKVNNREHLAGMVVFDLWIGNTDRKENNVLLEPVENGEHYLHMIDHGRCFSKADWTVKALKKMPKMTVNLNVHKWSISLMQSQDELQAAIEKTMSIPKEAIYDIINSIPADWEVSEAEREALVTHLVQAQQLLPKISVKSKKKK
ncbi:HipA family kinase [Anaerobacillus sp. MEB173]|uniref:HipA family kinase n=1 Tax=Anaerobacillus sp. MEB173 TaxID=3383345 RepID=UPI003F9206EF